MFLREVLPSNVLSHVGYTGGRSRDRKNKNYEEVGSKILVREEYPPFEHYNVTFDVDGSSRYLLYLLTTSRVITITANSQRYLEVDDLLETYTDDVFASFCLEAYKKARQNNLKKENARALLPLASKTADLSFTTNIRELNRLRVFFNNENHREECSAFSGLLYNYLKHNNVVFDEPLPRGFFPNLMLGVTPFSEFKEGKVRVIRGGNLDSVFMFTLEIPFYVWMQIIRHKSLHFDNVRLLDKFEPVVLEYLDSELLQHRKPTDPYHILNGQFVSVDLYGTEHAWNNFFRWRLERATQPITQQVAREISNNLFRS